MLILPIKATNRQELFNLFKLFKIIKNELPSTNFQL